LLTRWKPFERFTAIFILPSGFDSCLGEYFEQNPKDKHSGHRYRVKDFRQTDEDIASHFREYWEEFGNV